MLLTRQQRASLNGVAALKAKMQRTGMTPAGQPLWTDAEVSVLRETYPDMDALVRGLPGRSPTAIRKKAAREGLTHNRRVWTARDVLQMKPRYPTEEPVRQLAVFVSKQPRQVYGKASQLRLRRPRKPPVRVSDDLVHSIRQRAYELNIRLGELGDATSSGTYFRSPTKRRNYLAIVRALAVLGGEVRLG